MKKYEFVSRMIKDLESKLSELRSEYDDTNDNNHYAMQRIIRQISEVNAEIVDLKRTEEFLKGDK